MKISATAKILVIRLSSLGDVLLTTPMIRSLKKTYPGSSLHFLTRAVYSDVLKHNPYISKILFFENNAAGKVKGTIAAEKYDLIIDLQNNIRSASLLRNIQTPAVRFNKRTLDKFLLVNFKLNRLKNAPPMPVRYAGTIKGLILDDEGLDLITENEPFVKPQDGEKYIGFAPGARHFTKMWPEEYFIQLGNRLIDNGYKVILLGGRDDAEICRKISAVADGSLNLCGDDNILQIAANMKICSAVVCNDSGLMHTACAVKVPVLAIFGSTVKELGFTPYINKSLVLENKLLSCRPCSHIGKSRCPKAHFNCMFEITPGEAYKKLMDLLS